MNGTVLLAGLVLEGDGKGESGLEVVETAFNGGVIAE